MISNYFEIFILSFIQGFSEFLQVSSAAHLLIASNIDSSTFYSYNDDQKASLVRSELFVKRTPVSEACAGVLTILKQLNIEINNKSFALVCDEYDQKIQLRIIDNLIFNNIR